MPYKNLVPKLYRDGASVKLNDGTITSILFSVTLSELILCPHCGREVHITSAHGSAYAYYTATPPQDGSCCRPINYFELKAYHLTTDYLNYEEMMIAIKQDYPL